MSLSQKMGRGAMADHRVDEHRQASDNKGMMKRRGLIAGAAAMVAAAATAGMSSKVDAAIGGSNGQFMVLGANQVSGINNTAVDVTEVRINIGAPGFFVVNDSALSSGRGIEAD